MTAPFAPAAGSARTSADPSSQRVPAATVVIPTYNRRDLLLRVLRALDDAFADAAPADRFEVVVVVDGSSDGTQTALTSFAPRYPLRVLEQAQSGPAAARNRALTEARGDVVIFLDDDVLPAPDLISQHLAVHRGDARVVAIGPMLAPPGKRLRPWLEWEAAMVRKQYDAMMAGEYPPTPRQFYTANASVRREHALAAGGFDESFTRAEDVEFALRLWDLGLTFRFLPGATVWHEPHRSFASWLRVPYQYGHFDVRLYREKGRRYVASALHREYRRRHPLNRLVSRLCVGHPGRARAARWLLATVGHAAGACGLSRVSRFAYSGLFMLAYNQGFADTLGGADLFWRIIDAGEPVQSTD